MSQEDYPVEFVLESINSVMAPLKQPKVILFDVGGVCLRNLLFVAFITLNTSILQVVSPFQAILNYEISERIPSGWVNYSISKSSPNGSFQKLERGEILMDADFFTGFNHDLRDPQRWRDFWIQTRKKQNLELGTIPPVPEINGEVLFLKMMSEARKPDPWMWPALQKLKASGKYIIAALSNTVIFPPDHPLSHSPVNDVKRFFDILISSAHVGLRKPDPKIYELAVKELDKYAKEHASTKGKDLGWSHGIKPEDIIFLDDIGENLKAAKKAGFGTIKVNLGMTYDAVTALEELTGLQLAGDHPEISSAPKIPNARL